MPKTRKPKAAAPVADQVSAALAKAKNKLTPEDLKRYEFLLEDYDRQIEKKIDEIHKKAMDKVESHFRECMVSIMKLPTTTRKLNWEECAPYLMEPEPEADEHESEGIKEGSGSEAPCNDDKENKMRQLKDEIAKMKESAIKEDETRAAAAKSTVKGKRGRGGGPATGSRKSKRSTATTPGGLGSVDESILTSTINRTVVGGRGRRVLQTPGNISMVCPPKTVSKLPTRNLPLPGHEMMDGGVPATPAAFAKTDQPRVAKPNEVSYSQNWSPLINTTGTVARGGRTKRGAAAQPPPNPDKVALPLGGGRELQFDLDEPDDEDGPGLKLDPEAFAKVKAIHQKLALLLKKQ